jgi:beta-phosphoglucomutase-like phosphatase (HAD superfamily)
MKLDLIHSTSWRVDGPAVILTWIGIARADGLVIDQWPYALPVTTELYEKVGKPITHAADEPPTPRDVDVLIHAVRHLRFLRDTDESARAAMTNAWLQHLSSWEPALSGMYSEPHVVA